MPEPQLAQADGGTIPPRSNVYRLIANGVETYPDHIAIICAHQNGDHLAELAAPGSTSTPQLPLTWTHRDLAAAATKVALGLQNKGIVRGCTLVTIIPNRVEWAILMYTSFILGLTFAPLDFGMLTPPRREELKNLLALLKPTVVVVSDVNGAGAVDDALLRNEATPRILVQLDRPTRSDSWTAFSSIADNTFMDATVVSELLDAARQPNPEHEALIYFTSGTSAGKPKGCPRTVKNFASSHEPTQEAEQYRPDSRFLLISQNFRVISALAPILWSTGAAVVLPGAMFDAKQTLDTIERFKVTDVLLVPALLHAVVDEASFKERDLACVINCAVGGDVITRDVLRKAARAFPRAGVHVGHGMSEGGAIFRWAFSGMAVEDVPCYGEIAPLGVVQSGSKIRIVEESTGAVVARGQTGELQLSSPNVIDRYLDGVQTDAFLNSEGDRWFSTGDAGVMSDEGVVYIVGRVKDRIKRAGVPINPVALESSIARFAGCRTAVVGLPHAILGHEPFAILETAGARSRDEIEQHLHDVFGKDYALGGVATLQQLGLDTFPLNATGKVMKITLQAKLRESMQRDDGLRAST